MTDSGGFGGTQLVALPAAAQAISSAPQIRAHLPLKIALSYLVGTFLMFLVAGQFTLAPHPGVLTLFVTAALTLLTLGYLAGVRVTSRRLARRAGGPDRLPGRRLVLIAAAYFAALGVGFFVASPVASLDTLAQSLLHPGTSYFAQQGAPTVTTTSRLVQVLTLLGVLYPVLVPVTVLLWHRLTLVHRSLVLVGLSLYAAYYLSIGTLKGFGDLLLMWAAAFLVQRCGRRPATGRSAYRRSVVVLALGVTVFVGFMSYNQNDRLQAGGPQERFHPNPVLASVVGQQMATGLAVTTFYPTHGYLGLAHNLQTPFVWTHGLGQSVALSGYWAQYVGGDGEASQRYTARTERRSGWPDGMYWSTIFPWLASDLTFPGAALSMAVLGWFWAKFWLEAVVRRRVLSLLLFCQLAICVAFIPANHQLGQNRITLIGVVSLALLSVLARVLEPIINRRRTSRGAP